MQPSQIEYLPSEVAYAIKILWKDQGVRQCFQRSGEYQLNDSAEYYFDSIRRIGQMDYLPTDEDVLRSRVKTTGIAETTFNYKNISYDVYDVGGVRSQRKKWIHFKDMTVVIFVVDISAYDRLLFEDESVNRIQEALSVFDSVDIFEKKLTRVPINNDKYFPDYTGDPADLEAAKSYISDRFVSLNKNPDKRIRVHFTNVVSDASVVDLAFSAIRDSVIEMKSFRRQA
ncbi:guanine nucleotide-binding protein subunit alpha [Toensbergia leucococca]|nr:guanine nucleotide-binding protein subunit alpha [Toensbergia leucococca]